MYVNCKIEVKVTPATKAEDSKEQEKDPKDGEEKKTDTYGHGINNGFFGADHYNGFVTFGGDAGQQHSHDYIDPW